MKVDDTAYKKWICMEDLYRNLKEGHQVRETLAEMRSRAKDVEELAALRGLLYAAYAREQTLFVRSSYRKAMESLEVSEYLDRLQERQEAFVLRRIL